MSVLNIATTLCIGLHTQNKSVILKECDSLVFACTPHKIVILSEIWRALCDKRSRRTCLSSLAHTLQNPSS
jgi:hypothetical protein